MSAELCDLCHKKVYLMELSRCDGKVFHSTKYDALLSCFTLFIYQVPEGLHRFREDARNADYERSDNDFYASASHDNDDDAY
jgi:hypothetical protein